MWPLLLIPGVLDTPCFVRTLLGRWAEPWAALARLLLVVVGAETPQAAEPLWEPSVARMRVLISPEQTYPSPLFRFSKRRRQVSAHVFVSHVGHSGASCKTASSGCSQVPPPPSRPLQPWSWGCGKGWAPSSSCPGRGTCQGNVGCALKCFFIEMYPEVVYFFAFLGFPSLGGLKVGPRDCSLAG